MGPSLKISFASRVRGLDSHAQELLIGIYERNPQFNSHLLIEEYVADESNASAIGERFTDYARIIEDATVLKYAFMEVFKKLDGKRKPKSAKKKKRSKKHVANYISYPTSTGSNNVSFSDAISSANDIDTYTISQIFKNGSVAEKLAASLNKVKSTNGDFPQTIVEELQDILTLETLLVSYLIYCHYQKIADALLTANFEIISHLSYYQDLQDDQWYFRKLYHMLRILPEVASVFAFGVWSEAKGIVSQDRSGSYITTANATKLARITAESFWGNVNTVSKLPYNVLATGLRGYQGVGISAFGKSKIDTRSRNPVSIILQPFKLVLHVVKNYADWFYSLFEYPVALIDGYFNTKVTKLEELKYQNIEKLGALIKEFPEDYNTKTESSAVNQKSILKLQYILANDDLEKISNYEIAAKSSGSLDFGVLSHAIPTFRTNFSKRINALAAPQSIASHWPLIGFALLYGPSSAIQIFQSRYDIANWIRENLLQTIMKFYENWVAAPVLNIIATVRHDDSSQISITGKKSLTSDIESLERMIVGYLSKTNGGISTEQMAIIKQNVHDGDLTPFMVDYEQQIASPIRSLVAGDLLQSLLIQVQKVKVDGDLVISGIDKLLKSQELVFECIAVLPAGLVLIWFLGTCREVAKRGWRGIWSPNKGKYREASRQNLNQLERLLILDTQEEKGTEDYYSIGEMAIEVLLLQYNLDKIIPRNVKKYVDVDIGDLSSREFDSKLKIMVVEKMWRNYNRYLE
ncbi:Nca2 protein [Saccharomycopsis crataegensis]|uniref:Nca2 protein n=1 Tax=Saccharomycopsis crataegensis TaxID=43959 RepID=A0AAV5QQ08_9ASCO|nr:Nca2 protein [Saccharomycopsis crataegensis]